MTETTPAKPPQSAPKKIDPEPFTLGARVLPAIRFKRGAIIGIAAIGSAFLTTIGWVALRPSVPSAPPPGSELSNPSTTAAAEALAGLPIDYGDAPKLGPPLPGDLGRPILRAQERAGVERLEASPDPAEAARLERMAELKTARESTLMVPTNSSGATSSQGQPVSGERALPPTQTVPAALPVTPFALADHKQAGANQAGTDIPPTSSQHVLAAGSVIAASLLTGLNSDLPGTVTAQVSENVFDTATGDTLLVPQGARLIGRYESVAAFGQRRALVAWERLILPDGNSVQLDEMPATDPAGYAGLADKVDFHSWSLLRGIALASLLGVGTEFSLSGESDLVKAIREAGQSSGMRAGDQIVRRDLEKRPTITIRPGSPVRLLVTRDLPLSPWQGGATAWN